MNYISNIIFGLFLIFGFLFFSYNLKKIYRNIKLGKNANRNDNSSLRWKTMLRIALGQSKMTVRPVAGILHIIVYVGFVIINLEFIEIIIDGLFGTHRFLLSIFPQSIYNTFTGILEVLAILVIISVVIFFIRRNIINIKRFRIDLSGFPKHDANFILLMEFALMIAFLKMNAADFYLNKEGFFPVSTFLFSFYENFTPEFLHTTERISWWFHFIGILFFMNYLYYSKHLHILLAFPSAYFSNLKPLGAINNLDSVTKEVKLMLDPNANPYETAETSDEPGAFGAKDVFDLNQVQLLNAYTCTECGRCSDVCPANQTGKKLSPRKILMSTRDRLEEVGKNIDKNKGKFVDDGKQLLNDYISAEELWACTTCNACTDACPILLDPMSIIIEMRRYLVMEESSAPQELNAMMTNIENNSAPWQFNQNDRANWINE
ncbi:MAG: 4Fe-4S dicluster domain-containing protein [Flavobacteriales bacterium]|nr:4Fe-4S dicluster domain-containing protein [Flavobacteriales bacterium]